MTSAARYDRWKAPTEDGQVLIWPSPDQLLQDTRDNHHQLSAASGIRIQNVPLNEVRRQMREFLGHADDARPILATGHQAELHHPGVWVKNALMDAAAQKLGGRAYHFAVDTDEPKHLQLRWPGGSVPLTDDTEHLKAPWSGLVAPPTPAHLRRVEDEFSRAASHLSFRPMVGEFLASMRRLTLESNNLPMSLTNAVHALDWSLGLRHDAMITSPICLAEPYLLFVHHVLSRADLFAADYNAALDTHRRENKIRAPGRPMPNLKASTDACEVPFWLDLLSDESRARATVRRGDGGWELRLPSGEQFAFSPFADGWEAAAELSRWLRRNSVRLAPRALTLTAVLRLLVADQFVHGIGGAQYDQVLDRLIARHFALDPPRFSVTTATLYFPEAVGQPRVCLSCLIREGHRLKHSILGREKMQLVGQIASLPRRSSERATLFFQMHDRLSSAWKRPEVQRFEQQLRDAERRDQEERVLFDRELFYAIQPRERLTGLIDQYRAAFR